MNLLLFCEAEGDFRTVSGLVDPVRETWVLAGFDPESEAERTRLADQQRALGFSPCEEAHRLRDKNEGATRNPKRVLRVLTGEDPEREERCWTAPPLAVLRERGGESGLAAFLDEVAGALLPLCAGKAK